MRTIILGASGRLGRYLMRTFVAAHYDVVAVARSTSPPIWTRPFIG